MAKTGAEYGMELFWALVLSCIFTFILMVAYGKVTLVSGKTALSNIKQEFRYGWLLALYILISTDNWRTSGTNGHYGHCGRPGSGSYQVVI